MCLNLSLSVSWRLVLSWLLLGAVWERRLLVARGAAAARVLSRRVRAMVVDWVSVLLVKLADALAIPCICKVAQYALLRESLNQ